MLESFFGSSSIFLQDGNTLFSACLVIAMLFVALELVSVLLAGFDILNSFDIEFDLPEISIGDFSLFQINTPGSENRVPTSLLIFLFILLYGVIGTFLNSLTELTFAGTLLYLFTLIPAFIALRISAKTIAKIIPSIETDAISTMSFIGEECQIVVGAAAKNRPAQAKYIDPHGTMHTFMIEPTADIIVSKGEKMIITAFNKERNGYFFGQKSFS